MKTRIVYIVLGILLVLSCKTTTESEKGTVKESFSVAEELGIIVEVNNADDTDKLDDHVNQVLLQGVPVEYKLPSSEYSEIINNSNLLDPRHSIIIKFPELFSEKYQLTIIPNLSITAEQVPSEVTTLDYFFFQLETFRNFGIDTDQQEDDILECSMPSPMTFFTKYERDGVIHNIFHISSVYNGVAFSVIFDATDDIYHIYRDTLQEILKSLHVVESR